MNATDLAPALSALADRVVLAALLSVLGVIVCLLLPRWLAVRREQRLDDERARLQGIDFEPVCDESAWWKDVA